MSTLLGRLQVVLESLGNAGARANAGAELHRLAAARAEVDRLEQRLAAAAAPALLPDAA